MSAHPRASGTLSAAGVGALGSTTSGALSRATSEHGSPTPRTPALNVAGSRTSGNALVPYQTPTSSSSSSSSQQSSTFDGPDWHCHCCGAANTKRRKCRVCGREESYVLRGYPLPFSGNNANLFRPSQ
ncbi:hypothetical protein B484DRAFT_391208, partial [Ochromonadaceae sp. CCMP2298]